MHERLHGLSEPLGGERRSLVVGERSIAIEGLDPELAALLGSLDLAYPSCTLLLRASDLGRDAGVLIAASPERLVRVRGEWVTTTALAGTAPSEHAAALFSSAKLQLEHELTSRHIAGALADPLELAGTAQRQVGAVVSRIAARHASRSCGSSTKLTSTPIFGIV